MSYKMVTRPRQVFKMPIRVLHCIPSLNDHDGGPARSVPELAEAEALQGADVRVWSSRTPTIHLEDYRSTQFVTGRLRSLVSGNWTPDVIHDHGLWLRSNHQAAQISLHKRIPRIVSPRGMLKPWCIRHHRYRKLIAWKLYQHRDLITSSCLHATSMSEAEQFRELGLTQPVVLLPNGVTLPTAASLCDNEHKTRSNTKREVLFLSRIHPVKGLLNLISAWQNVVRSCWRLHIVGSDEGGHRAEIEKAISQRQLNNSVTVNDAVYSREKWKLLRNADLLILPSFSENFGTVVAEALTVGTPVITTTGTPWKNVLQERCGWYVEPNTEALTEALRDAMNMSRRDLKQMGIHGLRWVSQEFAWPEIGKKMLNAYESVLGAHSDASWIQPGTQIHRAA